MPKIKKILNIRNDHKSEELQALFTYCFKKIYIVVD